MPGNPAQARQWFRVVNLSGDFRNEEDPRRAEIAIFEQIGEDWFSGNGMTAGRFMRAIDALGDLDEILLRINSPGGDVMDGLTITNYLMQHPAKITVRVEGQAASIASVIMMAGEERVMGMGTSVFVHDPMTYFPGMIGDSEEMRSAAGNIIKLADELDKIRDGIIEVYQARVDLSREELITLMNDDTRMTAEEAVAWGFATSTDSAMKAAACADLDPVLAQAREQAVAMLDRTREFVDAETLKAENVALQASIAELNSSVANLTQEREALQQSVTDLTARLSPEPADAAMVITACNDAGIAGFAAKWVEQKLPAAEIIARIARASAIIDLCTAADEDAAPYLAQLDEPVEALRVALVSIRAAKDQNIDNSLQPGGEGHGRTGKGTTATIYRARNQHKILMKR